MRRVANSRAYEIAGKMGALLERERVQDVGVALGMVLGQFILIVEQSDEGISSGIDAIADDAKDVAIKIRNMKQ